MDRVESLLMNAEQKGLWQVDRDMYEDIALMADFYDRNFARLHIAKENGYYSTHEDLLKVEDCINKINSIYKKITGIAAELPQEIL